MSYRRADAAAFAGRISDRLSEVFGRESIYLDMDSISPGQDFVGVVRERIAASDVVLVVIGPSWLDGRLDDPDDVIRQEVAHALYLQKRVVPVLVDGAAMPSPSALPEDIAALANYHAISIGSRTFSEDVGRLLDALRQLMVSADGLGTVPLPPPTVPTPAGHAVPSPPTGLSVTQPVEPGPDVWQPGWLSDRPAQADFLNRKPIAIAIHHYLAALVADDERAPVVVQLDGPWGSGKSSVLNFLADGLDGDSRHDWTVVRHDAWLNQAVGPAWWSILRAMRKGVIASRGPVGRAAFRLREATHRAGLVWILLALVGAAVLGYLLVDRGLADTSGIAAAAVAVAGLAALLASSWKGLRSLILWDSPRGARRFVLGDADPMSSVVDHFRWLAARFPAHPVLLVDDLDRCNPSYVVEFLDNLQTLSQNADPVANGNRIFAIVAADSTWIRRCYDDVFAAIGDLGNRDGRSVGDLFVEKIFALSISVPQLGPELRREYLAYLVAPNDDDPSWQPDLDELQATVAGTTNEVDLVAVLRNTPVALRHNLGTFIAEHMLSDSFDALSTDVLDFAQILEPNPRAMKRFLARYTFARIVRTAEGSAVRPGQLAVWTAVEMRWPSLARRLRDDPDLVGLLDAPPPREDNEAAHRDWSALNAAEVRGVLATGERLSPESIRECAGLTLGTAPAL